MKQTSIEWLIEQMLKGKFNMNEVFEQAKEMHKQEIIEAFLDDLTPSKQNIKEAEQYYQETFKK